MQRHEWITALKIPNVVTGVDQSWSLIFYLQAESVMSEIPSKIKWRVSFLSSLFPEEAWTKALSGVRLLLEQLWKFLICLLISFISAAPLKQKVITMSINTKQALLIRDEQKTS